MDTPISRAEFNAYKETCESEYKRLEAEDKRQNDRLKELEVKTAKILDLATSVQSLADSVERMLTQLESQDKRINTLESRDGEMWRKVMGYIAVAITGIVIGAIAFKLGVKVV